MKSIYSILLIFIIGCTSKKKDFRKGINPPKSDTINLVKIDTIPSNIEEKSKVTICECKTDTEKHRVRFNHKVIFYNYNSNKEKNDTLFNYWANDSLQKKLKSIEFIGYDTIPEKFKLFTEVEKVAIDTRKGIHGLDYFPKLNDVVFWGSRIRFNPKQKWSNKIKFLQAEKTTFENLTTFKQFKNLRTLYFTYMSNKKELPTDFNEMRCIKKITISAFYGDINLEKIDLSKVPCLEEFEIHSWHKYKGIPKGLENHPSLKTLNIKHSGLTKEEKEILKKYKK